MESYEIVGEMSLEIFNFPIRNEDCGLGSHDKNNIFDSQLGDLGEHERGSLCPYGSHILKGKTDMLTGAQTQWKRQVSRC